MKRCIATLLLAFALLAGGCGDQDAGDVPAVQTDNTSDRTMTLPQKDPTPEEATEELPVDSNPVVEKNSSEEAIDEETTDNQSDNKSSGITQSTSQTNEQGTAQENEQGDIQGEPPNDEPPPPQGNEQGNIQGNVQSTKTESSFADVFDENLIPILAGVIVLLLIVVVVLLYKINNKKAPPKPSNVPPKPSELPKPPPPISTIDDSPMPIEDATSTLIKRPAFLVGTLHNVGKREEQQDSFCVSNSRDEQALRQKGLMAVVADGMGGLEGGSKISKLVTNTFVNSYNRQAVPSTANFLYNTAAATEKEVEKFIEREGITGGSTLVAIMIRNYNLDFLSVGDSHIYLFQNGMLTQLNREHNYGEVLKEKAARNEVSPEEPYRNSQRHSLTAYIGMGSFDIVDKNAQPITLKTGDKVFLCSDGVYNALGDDALIALLKSDAVTAAKKIEASILSQNLPKQDNFTGVIVELYEK